MNNEINQAVIERFRTFPKCQQSVQQILANGESVVAVLTCSAAILLKCERGEGATFADMMASAVKFVYAQPELVHMKDDDGNYAFGIIGWAVGSTINKPAGATIIGVPQPDGRVNVKGVGVYMMDEGKVVGLGRPKADPKREGIININGVDIDLRAGTGFYDPRDKHRDE
jgi:hypothetical protein